MRVFCLFCRSTQNLKNLSKIQAKIVLKSVNSSRIFENRRSHYIESRFCLSLLGAFQKSAYKIGVCVNPAYVTHYIDSSVCFFIALCCLFASLACTTPSVKGDFLCFFRNHVHFELCVIFFSKEEFDTG